MLAEIRGEPGATDAKSGKRAETVAGFGMDACFARPGFAIERPVSSMRPMRRLIETLEI